MRAFASSDLGRPFSEALIFALVSSVWSYLT
jgi:hypothetical protein